MTVSRIAGDDPSEVSGDECQLIAFWNQFPLALSSSRRRVGAATAAPDQEGRKLLERHLMRLTEVDVAAIALVVGKDLPWGVDLRWQPAGAPSALMRRRARCRSRAGR